MLNPLEQFICDSCGQVMGLDDGCLAWLQGAGQKATGFRIVHNRIGCHYPPHTQNLSDLPLRNVAGVNGMAQLYALLDIGPYHDPHGQCVLQVANIREYMEVLRRLTLPFYEEARLYWNDAQSDGYFDGANEVGIYLPSTLENLISRYGRRDRLTDTRRQ